LFHKESGWMDKLSYWGMCVLEHVLFTTRDRYYTAQDPRLTCLEVLIVQG